MRHGIDAGLPCRRARSCVGIAIASTSSGREGRAHGAGRAFAAEQHEREALPGAKPARAGTRARKSAASEALMMVVMRPEWSGRGAATGREGGFGGRPARDPLLRRHPNVRRLAADVPGEVEGYWAAADLVDSCRPSCVSRRLLLRSPRHHSHGPHRAPRLRADRGRAAREARAWLPRRKTRVGTVSHADPPRYAEHEPAEGNGCSS